MITDQLLVLADNQALTKSAPSTNVVDLLQDKPTPGMSKLLYLCVIVNEAVTGTLQPILEDSADNSTYTTAASGPLMNAPAAGTIVYIPVPFETKRYLRCNWGGAPTAGKVTAHFTWDLQVNHGFAQRPALDNQPVA